MDTYADISNATANDLPFRSFCSIQTFKLGVQSFLAMVWPPVHVLHMWILLDITNSQVKGLAAKNHETRDPGSEVVEGIRCSQQI